MANFSQLNSAVTATLVVNNTPLSIQLDGVNAPNTGGNFADLVERGFYDGITFHRVEKNPRPFVIQAGDPNSKDPTFPINQLGSGNFIDPETGQPRFIPLEIKVAATGQTVFGQTFAQAGVTGAPLLSNLRGSIAMARSSNPNSASSQFYINLADNAFLDGNYAVFGNVTANLAAIDTIAQGATINGIRITDGILPSRTSGFMPTELLNGFANRLNQAVLNIKFQSYGDENNNLVLTAAESLANPTGFLMFGGNDVVTGSSEADVIYGGKGNDQITGGVGNDLLRGGQDNDTIDGGVGNDIIHGNFGVDIVTGGEGNDFLRGGQSGDNLNGGAGNDVLVGDKDRDTLTGGAGADAFVLRSVSDLSSNAADVDVITDFLVSEGDILALSGEIDATTVTIVASGADALVQVGNQFLGRIQNGAANTNNIAGAVSIVGASDLGVSFG